ncbi:MAG: S41 family peptidase [Myxococcota bacterium]
MWMWLALACISEPPPSTGPALIDEVHELVDTRYALFVDKQVDWEAARQPALDALNEGADLQDTVVEMLDVLRDGHVNLATPGGVSTASAFLEERVPTWDEDLVQRHVLDFDFAQRGSVQWSIPDPSWAYLRVDDFSNLPTRETLDLAFAEFAEADRLILDLRANGGGRLEQARTLLERFVEGPLVGWHLEFSTGPGHEDLSEPAPRELSPVTPGFEGPLAVLVDGRTYSAANVVAFVLAERADTMLVGATTGGGAGSPTWHELSNGWELRFPTIRLTGPDRQPMEDGRAVDVMIAPDPGQPEVDVMIEAALDVL